MGCGISSDSAGTGVLGNTVTQNGRANRLHPDSAAVGHKPGEEELDLNLEDPELQEAATKIQAAFRGHQTRTSMKMAQEEEVIDIDLNDPEVSQAATKIQASFRGHQARKAAKPEKKSEDELTEEMEKVTTEEKEGEGDGAAEEGAEGGEAEGGAGAEGEEELDIDLEDPDLNKAATKIQAQFRGHAVRKPKKDADSPNDE